MLDANLALKSLNQQGDRYTLDISAQRIQLPCALYAFQERHDYRCVKYAAVDTCLFWDKRLPDASTQIKALISPGSLYIYDENWPDPFYPEIKLQVCRAQFDRWGQMTKVTLDPGKQLFLEYMQDLGKSSSFFAELAAITIPPDFPRGRPDYLSGISR